MRILVVIANYGSRNDQYIERVLAEYRSMPYQVHIVVLSNIPKDLGPDVEVKVGLPSKNPYSLPFGHKRVFAERVNEYDLFIYSEDDILITTDNVDAFLRQSAVLPSDQVPGFLRFEKDPNGTIRYCDIFAGYAWDSQSVRRYGEYVFAYFSNEHSACYLLSRPQLQTALMSGRFLVQPHEGMYYMRETAATDPFTQCGFRKMICISRLRESSVHHLPNNYVGKWGIAQCDVRAQVNAMLGIERGSVSCAPLIQMNATLQGGKYLREHYAPARTEVLSLLDERVKSVLSFGCGETEIALARKGMRVVAVPVDSVVSAPASDKGVELVCGNLEAVDARLNGQSFDCLLLIDVLHLVEHPIQVIASFMQYLKQDAQVIAVVPNISGVRFLWRSITRKEGMRCYRKARIIVTSPGLVRKWFRKAGAVPEAPIYIAAQEGLTAQIPRLRVLSPAFAKEFIVRAKQRGRYDLS